MKFEEHSKLRDKHAFLSPSNYHWINYTDERFDNAYIRAQAKEKGTKLHKLACDCINLGIRLPNTKSALNMFVNDAIGYKMIPEQILYYSDNCFGTADAIKYSDNLLRIHDLKTGETAVPMHQLEIYAALFFLEYGPMYRIELEKTDIELRIYQRSTAIVHIPDKREISRIMGRIQTFDKRIQELKGD